MKPYFHKELTERPRYGGKYTKKKYAKRSLLVSKTKEELPNNESVRKLHDERKGFSDHIKPLYRFLLSNVGRSWNEVHSEISEHIKLSSTVQRHILEHVDGYVETEVEMIDGEPYYSRQRSWQRDSRITSSSRYTQLYVNPETGILCKAKTELPKPRAIDYTLVVDPERPKIQYRKIYKNISKNRKTDLFVGFWYRLELDHIPELVTETRMTRVYDSKTKQYLEERTPETFIPGTDAFLGLLRGLDSGMLEKYYGNPNLYCWKMSQVNSEDLVFINSVLNEP